MKRAAARLATALLSSVSMSCSLAVEGDFDGVVFAPTSSAVLILDQHEILIRDGALVPVERARAQRPVHLWLSSASVPVDTEWRRLPSAQLLDLKKALATSDLLVLRNIDFDALQDGDTLTAEAVDGTGNGRGDFSFSVAQSSDDDDDSDGIGSRVTVAIEARSFTREGSDGHLDAVITIKRERNVEQPASELATGEVTITVSLSTSPERLSEANLAILAPIAACAADVGIDLAAGCLAAAAEDVVDATGVH